MPLILTTMKVVWLLVQLLLAVVVVLLSSTTHAFTTGPLRADPNNVGGVNGVGGTSTKTSTASIIPLSAGIGYDGPRARFDPGGGFGGGGVGFGGGYDDRNNLGPSRYGYGPSRGPRNNGPNRNSNNNNHNGGRYRRRNNSSSNLQMANYMGNGRRGNEYYGGEYFGNRFDDYSNGNLQYGGGTGGVNSSRGGRSMQYSNSRSGYDDNRMGRRDYDYGPMSSGRGGGRSSRSGSSANRFYNNDYDDLPRGDMTRGGGRGGMGYDRRYNDYDYDRRGPSVGGGLARYQNSDYFDSSSSFYNNEGKRVRRFDPYYDQSDSYYDEGSLYDRYKTDAMNSQRRRYNSQGGGLRRYDPYFDGRRGDLYDENRLYDKGSGAYGLSGNFGPREYRLPSGDRDFYDQYDYDRYYDDYDRGYGGGGGGGMRGGGGYGYSDRSGRRSSLGSNRRVAGNSMYERDLQTKYIPEGNGREFGRRIDTRGGGRGPRRGMDGDYYDDDEPRFLGRGSEVDDTMEDFREGRGVKGRPSYNGMGTGGNGNAGFNSQTGYTGNNRDRRGGMRGDRGGYDNSYYYAGENGAGRGLGRSGSGGRGSTVNGKYYPDGGGSANGGMSIDDLKDML